jgi:hypothetical protein
MKHKAGFILARYGEKWENARRKNIDLCLKHLELMHYEWDN